MTARRRAGAALLAVLGIGCGSPRGEEGAASRGSVFVGSAVRTYTLVDPGATGAPRPLVLAFHGTGESGRAMRRTTALDSLAHQRGFLVAYPDAAVGNWAEGCDCSRADLEGVNDTGFVRALVDDVARRAPVDRARVYAVGFSQGALFVQRLACQMADLVVAVAGVGAPISSRLAETCAPAAPVNVLILQGTLDDAYPYEGIRRGGLSLLGAREAARFWRQRNGCATGAQVREWPDRVADGTQLLDERWEGCRDGVTVRLATVVGGRHAWWPSADVATETVLAEHFTDARRAASSATHP